MDSPATLNEAIAAQPSWLQAWMMALTIVHVLALALIVSRTEKGWRLRPEPIAILARFLTQMCARFSPRRSATPWEEPVNQL